MHGFDPPSNPTVWRGRPRGVSIVIGIKIHRDLGLSSSDLVSPCLELSPGTRGVCIRSKLACAPSKDHLRKIIFFFFFRCTLFLRHGLLRHDLIFRTEYGISGPRNKLSIGILLVCNGLVTGLAVVNESGPHRSWDRWSWDLPA